MPRRVTGYVPLLPNGLVREDTTLMLNLFGVAMVITIVDIRVLHYYGMNESKYFTVYLIFVPKFEIRFRIKYSTNQNIKLSFIIFAVWNFKAIDLI